MTNAITKWHQLVETKNIAALGTLLAEDVVFHSPVVHTPQRGRDITLKYLSAAFHVFFNGSFRYVREIIGERDAMLEFELEMDGVQVNGVDIISWNENDQITSFKVMVRPRKGMEVVAAKMMAMLQSMAAQQ